MRGIAYTRRQRSRHIKRKCRIIKRYWNGAYWKVKHDGQLSKGKIHCSCPMCRIKSYDERSHSDKRKIDAMNNSVKEYNEVS